jgi:hypothetical protein
MKCDRELCLGLLFFALFVALIAPMLPAQVIVNDSWADGTRSNGPDPLDSNWWTSSNVSGIEVSPGSLGMVTGATGRGIHTVFPTQTLSNVGDSVRAAYTFTTPPTVGTNLSASFRVGLFDTLGRPELDGDITASTAAPHPAYGYYAASTTGLPGYMMDMDVNTGVAADLSFRQHDTPVNAAAQTPTGRLMGTTTGFTQVANTGPDAGYTFAPNTLYSGSISITRIDGATEADPDQFQITGTLTTPSGTTTHSVIDPAFDSANINMLAFWANSSVFGTSSTPGTADNGIDFSNVQVEFVSVPEPGSLSLLALGLGWVARRRRG